MSVVFITHKIRETMAVCDALTVMRDGKRVGTVRRADTSAAELATLMVGDDAAVGRVTEVVTAGMGAPEAARAGAPKQYLSGEARDLGDAPVRVSVRDLVVHNDHGVPAVHDVGFEVRRGEIVGIAGVAGNGQVELAEGVSGVRGLHSGRSTSTASRSPAGPLPSGWSRGRLRPRGPPPRRHPPSASIMENLVLGAQRSVRFRKGPLMD